MIGSDVLDDSDIVCDNVLAMLLRDGEEGIWKLTTDKRAIGHDVCDGHVGLVFRMLSVDWVVCCCFG